jgi:adenosylcobinamide-phosphate synthase
MGRWIETWEPYFRRLPIGLAASGSLFVFLLVPGTWLLTWALLRGADAIHGGLFVILQTILIYYAISVRSLRSAAMEIYHLMKSKDLSEAKNRLSYIVGRDVQPLDAGGVMRGAAETVAENLVDGVVSPLFYAAIGGAPLALAYKMVNTLDSMIGYKNERYLRFGRCAARVDDVANFVPARLSVPLVSLAALFYLGRFKETFLTAVREGKNHHSPNAGFPEAAFAGALGIRLNGPAYYDGQLVSKPYLGVQFRDIDVEDIDQACDLMVLSSFLHLMFCWVFVALV